MKDFFRSSQQYKEIMAMFFTSEIIIYIIVGFIYGQESINLNILIQLLIIANILTGMQYIFYGSNVLYKLSEFKKLILHYFALIITTAIWLKVIDNLKNKQILLIILGVSILFIITAESFKLYYKVTGEKYNEKLMNYKNKIK